MLRDGITSNGIYLFGGSASSSTMTEEAWVRDFKGMRGISCCLTLDAVRHIRAKFFSSENVADELPSSHSPIHFVEFDIEYPDVAKDRLPLYAALSSPKLNCMMARTTHYMNALSLKPFVLIDTGAITRAAHLLQSINTVAPQAIKC